MRGLHKYIAALGLLACCGMKPLASQILIPEEIQASENNLTLLQSAGAKLWAVQLISENSGIFTYSLSAKQSGTWKRLPAFKLLAQNKNVEFTDVEVFHDRIYLSGTFIEPNSKNNCLIYFDQIKQEWIAPYLFGPSGQYPVVNTLALTENALYLGGYFKTIGGSRVYSNIAKIAKDFTAQTVGIKTNIGINGPVTGIESDTLGKVIHISGFFNNIFGTTTPRLAQFRIADSTLLQTAISYGSFITKMRAFGSKLLVCTEDSTTKERKIFFLSSGTNAVLASGLDSLYSVSNFFINKGIVYFIGDAQPEFDLRSIGIFRISEVSKTERVYRQFYKVQRAEGFEGNIYVHGSFARLLSNSVVYDNFNLARIDDNFRRFYGRVFHDQDSNGKYGLNDKLVGGNNVSVFANGTLHFVLPVEKNGYFTFIIPVKTTIVFKVMVQKTVELAQVSSYIFRADTFNEKLVDFPVKYQSNSYNNVRISVTAAAGWQLRKDTTELYVIKISNTGLLPAQPDVVLALNGKINGIQATPSPYQIDPGTETKLTWKLSAPLQPGAESSIMIKLNAPSSEFADDQVIDFNASFANYIDNNPADDHDTLQQTVTTLVGANSKFQYPEVPDGEPFAWLDPNAGKIEYVIRFTNVSADTVSTVVVRDTIATPDYVTYIQETGSSHPFTRLVYTNPALPNKVIVAYTFTSLSLPPNPTGNSELVNSSGYVGFKLGLKPNLSSGTDLQNRASIYLDNNEPILTPMVAAKVASTAVKKVDHLIVKKVYPNPVDKVLYLENVTKGERFTLYSLSGQLLLDITLDGNSVDLSNCALSPGNYVWSTITADGLRSSGIITKN